MASKAHVTWLALLLAACGSSGTPPPPPTVGDGLPASCSPLRSAGACALPFPNAIDLVVDGTTKTGFRVALAAETLPTVSVGNKPLDPVRFNMADGYSPGTPILAYFPERLDPTSLVPPDDPSPSLSPSSPTLLVDMDQKALVAHFSELDETVYKDSDRQALILRPMARLLPGHRYAVGIRGTIKTLAGGAPTPPPFFASIAADHAPSDPRSKAEAARMPDILAALASVGVAAGDLLLAWDFVTASDDWNTSHLLSMRDQAFTQVGTGGIGYTIASVEANLDAKVLRRIRGTFTVPQFLSQTDPTNPDATLTFDATGKPTLVGQYQAPFTVIIPAIAATSGPLPLVLFGHGLLGSGETELGGAEGSYLQDLANLKGYVLFATDWVGLSRNEDPLVSGSSGAAAEALKDFNHLPWITDRLQQALVNAMTLERTMRGMISHDAAMTVSGQSGGTPVADASKVFYYGISLGGIMGGSFMGYDPDVLQGVLNVGAGNWSTLMQRSSNWRLFKLIVDGSYPDTLDQQLLLALAQSQFDFSDPYTVAPYLLSNPLAGVPKKQIVRQMAVGDAQVPNLATEIIARTEALPLLAETALPIWNMTPTAGPLPSVLSTWDIHPMPLPPTTNATPTSDNQAHGGIRSIPQLEDQIDHFIRMGEVISTCSGPCSF